VTRQRNGLAFREAIDGDGPDGPDLRGGWYWLVAARDGYRDQGGYNDPGLEHLTLPFRESEDPRF
jgi:hypothetical protein